MKPITITTTDAIDQITSNLDSLDGNAIAQIYELVLGGKAIRIDGGLEWTPEAEPALDHFKDKFSALRDVENPEGEEFSEEFGG